jgi:hypothetical protein
MTTTLDLVNRVRANLLGARQDGVNTVNVDVSDIPDDDTGWAYNIELAFPIEGLAVGSVVGTGAFVYQVVSVNLSAKSFVGLPLDRFDDATPPPASGDLIRLNPEYTDLAIMRALNQSIADMSSPTNGLFNFTETIFQYEAARSSYEVDSANQGIQMVLEVSYDVPGPERTWHIVPRNQYTVKREADLNDFPSGISLTLARGGYPGRDVRVVFAVPLPQIDSWTNNDPSPLDSLVEDIPVLGATAALLGPNEAKRGTTGAQSDTRRASEVPAGSNAAAARWFQQEYQRRIAAEAARNARLWPHRRRTH